MVIAFQHFSMEVLSMEKFSVPYSESHLSFCNISSLIMITCFDLLNPY